MSNIKTIVCTKYNLSLNKKFNPLCAFSTFYADILMYGIYNILYSKLSSATVCVGETCALCAIFCC